jgi:glyoxylase-like metal-dependent hydrolase (beta-lactamase superfamily II)
VPELTVGVASALSPLVRRIVAPNPGMMTGPGTNTYLIGIDEIAVIDPGPEDDSHLDAIAGCGGDRIRWILTTHTHPDHSPGAKGLQERTGAPVLGYAAIDGFTPDEQIGDRFRLEGTEFNLQAVHTPGHASNHLCFLLQQERMLFSGDHIMQGSTVVISPPDGDMAQYMASLAKVRGLRLRSIAPGHGNLIEDPNAAIDEYVTHRLAREAQVLALVEEGVDTAAVIVERIYTETAEELLPVARKSVFAHLRKLAEEGRVMAVGDGDDIDGAWRAAPGH